MIRPAILRAMPLPEIRQRIAAADTPALLDQLAAECDRRRSAGAAKAAHVARLRCRALKAVATRRTREAAAPPALKAAQQKAPLSLLGFLVKRGGLRDPRGELRAIMGTPKARVGLMNNRSGLTLDHAAQLALDAGYFPEHMQAGRGTITAESLSGALREGGAAAETMTPAVLLDAIDLELRGKARRWPHGEAPIATRAPDPDREAAEAEAVTRNAALLWQRLVAEADRAGVEGVYAFLFAGGVLTPTVEIPF